MSKAEITSRPTSHNQQTPRLALRDGSCGTGAHGCKSHTSPKFHISYSQIRTLKRLLGLDIGRSDRCCNNDSYCYIDKTGEPRCCPVGSNCVGDSNCKSEAYYCTVTTTISGGFTTDQKGCCNRKCPQTSYYLCPPDLGGKCCPYGSDCQAGGNCLEKKTASPTSVTGGVTTGTCVSCSDQTAGSGPACCSRSSNCSSASQTGTCVIADGDATSDHILSSGAKTGIGMGVGIGTSIIFGILVWLCISKRRRRGQRTIAGDNGTEKRKAAPDCAEMIGTVPQATKGLPSDNLASGARAADSLSAIGSATGPPDALSNLLRGNESFVTGDICSVHQTPDCDATSAPVEISSTELSRPTYELSATSAVPAAHRAWHIEEIAGVFELDGLEIQGRESSESGRLSRLQHIPYDKEMQ